MHRQEYSPSSASSASSPPLIRREDPHPLPISVSAQAPSPLHAAINEFRWAMDERRAPNQLAYSGRHYYPAEPGVVPYQPAHNPGLVPGAEMRPEMPPFGFPFEVRPEPVPTDASKAESKELQRENRTSDHPHRTELLKPPVQTMDQLLERLPAEHRLNPEFRRIAQLRDPAHGEEPPNPDKHGREALAAWEFVKNERVDPTTIRREVEEIDYHAGAPGAAPVPFDPFLSPLSGPGREPTDEQVTDWARAQPVAAASEGSVAASSSAAAAPKKKKKKGGDDEPGSYYKHTHGKGGQDTIGVWDQTYSSQSAVRRAGAALDASGARRGASVREVRVPLAEMYAREHIAAEAKLHDARAYHEEVRRQYAAAGGDPTRFVDALHGRAPDHGRDWRAELAKHPAWKKDYGPK
jgi:hypothetical protein